MNRRNENIHIHTSDYKLIEFSRTIEKKKHKRRNEKKIIFCLGFNRTVKIRHFHWLYISFVVFSAAKKKRNGIINTQMLCDL